MHPIRFMYFQPLMKGLTITLHMHYTNVALTIIEWACTVVAPLDTNLMHFQQQCCFNTILLLYYVRRLRMATSKRKLICKYCRPTENAYSYTYNKHNWSIVDIYNSYIRRTTKNGTVHKWKYAYYTLSPVVNSPKAYRLVCCGLLYPGTVVT